MDLNYISLLKYNLETYFTRSLNCERFNCENLIVKKA